MNNEIIFIPDKEIIMIVGADETNGIGRNNDLPWPNIPTDKKFFAKETKDFDVVMGSKTFWSIPPEYRPLKNRNNSVVTRNLDNKVYPEGVTVVTNLANAIKQSKTNKIFLIGGAGIYSEGLKFAQKILLTRIFYKDEFPCDVFFPTIPDYWKRLPTGPKVLDEKSEIWIRFEVWINTKNPPPSFYE